MNFDGITYAKGASVLKQLVAWVGIEDFLAGLREYFNAHEFANSEFSRPARRPGEGLGPRAASPGPRSGCRPPASTRCAPDFELDADGRVHVVRRRAERGGPATRRLRRTGIGIGLYDRDRQAGWSGVPPSRSTSSASAPRSPSWSAQRQPDLLLLNDGDLTYAKIRLDERSLATARGRIAKLDDSLARALCWGAAWDMTRDAEMSASDFVDAGARAASAPRPTRRRQPAPGVRPDRRRAIYSDPDTAAATLEAPLGVRPAGAAGGADAGAATTSWPSSAPTPRPRTLRPGAATCSTGCSTAR